MYCKLLGFSGHPFDVTINPRFFYFSPTHCEALEKLVYGIGQKKGVLTMVGEVGCGKTLMCRILLDILGNDYFEVAWCRSHYDTFEELVRDIFNELSIPPIGNDVSLRRIETALLKKMEMDKDVVLIVDEAQNLSFEMLEKLRFLSNLETDQCKLLQILLVGQTELKTKINQPQLRQLKQRISVHCDLSALDIKETRAYINHRLSLVCRQRPTPLFSYDAFRKVFRYTKGIPRIINDICDKSLLSVFRRQSGKIETEDVENAVREIARLST
jgi:general secretion pathway protein A